MGHEVVPSLQAIPLRWGKRPNVIAAVGRYDGIIVSEKGHLLETFGLPVSLIFRNPSQADFASWRANALTSYSHY